MLVLCCCTQYAKSLESADTTNTCLTDIKTAAIQLNVNTANFEPHIGAVVSIDYKSIVKVAACSALAPVGFLALPKHLGNSSCIVLSLQSTH